MGMRDKLIELMTDLPCHAKTCLDCEFFNTEECYRRQKEIIADNLIANGVTFAEDINVPSKWISVEERLPEDNSDVLAYLRIGEEGRIYPANYAKGMWFDCIFNTPATDSTTHWMPLPEPPKE